MDGADTHESRPRGPRLYHKKSRMGCLRCKQRRVKCDELRPSCSSCSRHFVECVYPTQSPALASGKSTLIIQPGRTPLAHTISSTRTTPEATAHRSEYAPSSTPSNFQVGEAASVVSPHNSRFYPSPSESHPTTHVDETEDDVEFPDGPERRLWELRLMHNSQIRMTEPFAKPLGESSRRMWTEEVPDMAFSFAQKEARYSLLYIELAHSALHMWTTSTDKNEREELLKLQQTYQLMCSREQRHDIAEIPRANPKLLDYICFTALRILTHSLALVQTLSVDPWEPPLQWLYMGYGAGGVFHKARSELKAEHQSIIGKYAESPPSLRDPTQTILSDHSALDWLLDHPSHPSSIEAQTDQELNEEGVRSVYEKALAYTCSVHRAIDAKEERVAISRRLGGFAVWVPIEFSKFIEQRRPRALVILAHFMALWIDYEDVWLFGRAGEWQIRCIYKHLPVEWSCKLDGLFSKFKQRDWERQHWQSPTT
ncbi:hypothetical protein F4808DRAFT_133261 [Astrocystis sublimbata]|nr:hypothetical protein F4808DRAFT_133261 [Astrocystis sublimbata]